MDVFDLDQPNNKIILKNNVIKSRNRELVNSFYNNLKSHWFNQKFEIILPINGTTNDDPIEKIKKSKGSLLSKKSLSGRLLIESEFTQIFQQYNDSNLPEVNDDEDNEANSDNNSNQQNQNENSNNDDGDIEIKETQDNQDIEMKDNNNDNNNNNKTKNNRNKKNNNKNKNINTNINLDKSSYYKIETTLDLILSQDFLNKYIRSGGFHALSQFNYIDSGNVFAILPNGLIILNVNKETYQDLGLVGKPSVFKSTERYVITLDSNSKELSANSKYYNRLMWALKDRLSSITLLCFYQKDYNQESKSSSIIHPIKFPKGVKVKRMFNQVQQSIEKHHMPTIEIINQYLNNDEKDDTNNSNDNNNDNDNKNKNNNNNNKNNKNTRNNKNNKDDQDNKPIIALNGSKDSKLLLSDFVNEFIEILGLISIEAEPEIEKDLQLSNCLLSSTPLPTEIFKASLKGFISNSIVIETISKIKTLIKNGTIEYGCLVIHGFADTPISWGSIEHNYLFGGENDQCLLILPNNQYLNLNLIGTLDYYC